MRDTMQPLTKQEQRFAEENHNIIYKFLHKYGYSIDEHYNIAVFGYLKSVQAYHRKEKLKGNYNFSHIAYQYMRAEISNQRKTDNTKKRKPLESILSLDSDYAETENLYHCIGGKSVEDEVLELEKIAELLENLSDIQRKIITLKISGFNNGETILFLNMKRSTYYKELERIRSALENN